MKIKVQKKNPAGVVTYEYSGHMLNRDANSLTLEAFFDRDDRPFMDVVLKRGDRFVEYYFSDRWYNIFEIHDRDDEQIKGWYCNICLPAEIGEDVVTYIDLALDLWVSADNKQAVLDEDEFDELNLDQELRSGALNGLKDLQLLFESKIPSP